MMTEEEAYIQELIDKRMVNTLETETAVKPAFERLVKDFTELEFYATDIMFVLHCDNADSKYYGVYYTGYYDKESQSVDIDMKSEESIDLFHSIFHTAAKIDIEHINRLINEFRFMYAFILGKNVDYQIDSIDDMKENFRWNGENYQFNVRPFDDSVYEQKYFSIKVFYDINIEVPEVCQYYKYEFHHPEIGFSLDSFNCFEALKREFFAKAAHMMNKSVSELRMSDYKVLAMLNY